MSEVAFSGQRVNIYTQNDGVVMGSPLAPTMLELYMSATGKQFLKNNNNNKKHFKSNVYTYYSDHMFVVIKNI